MMFKQFLVNAQREKVNYAFKNILYIDPYPNKLILLPRYALTSFMNWSGFFIFITTILIINSALQDFSKSENPLGILDQFRAVVQQTTMNFATTFSLEHLNFLGYIVPAMFLVSFSLFIIAHSISYDRVYKYWRKNATLITSKLLASEVQKRRTKNIDTTDRTRICYTYIPRIKVEFSYKNKTYIATPSVINRLEPGAHGINFIFEKDCYSYIEKIGNTPTIEINPRNPLDCEIEGVMRSLMKGNDKWWIAILILGIILFAISRIFVAVIL